MKLKTGWLVAVCGVLACGPSSTEKPKGGSWVDPNACVAKGTCTAAAEVKLKLEALQSIATEPGANPEIVRIVPGDDHRVVFVSALAKKLTVLRYSDTTVAVEKAFAVPNTGPSTELTSIDLDPTGKYVAITRAEQNCAKGSLMLVELSSGTVVGTLEVGYNPDSADFSDDGKWIVVVDEDDREERPCKPSSRRGGSITVIGTPDGVSSAKVVQTLAVDHHLDSEPEGVKVSGDNDVVVVSIQETSEYGIFRLKDVPNAKLVVTELPRGSRPDGIGISPDSSFAIVDNEGGDSFTVISLPDGLIKTTYTIYGTGDVPESYNRDESKPVDHHEPEEVSVVKLGGALFSVHALQESHAVIGYNLTDLAKPKFDSIALSGIGHERESFGRRKSVIGPEGLAVNSRNGVVFAANEREGTVTMFRTVFTRVEP